MNISLGLVFLVVILTGISQVLLKKGAGNSCGVTGSFLSPYLNPYTISAYALLLFTTMISVIALKVVPLKVFYAIASLNFVVVAMLSWGFLKEQVSGKMIIGIGLIVVGVVVFNV